MNRRNVLRFSKFSVLFISINMKNKWNLVSTIRFGPRIYMGMYFDNFYRASRSWETNKGISWHKYAIFAKTNLRASCDTKLIPSVMSRATPLVSTVYIRLMCRTHLVSLHTLRYTLLTSKLPGFYWIVMWTKFTLVCNKNEVKWMVLSEVMHMWKITHSRYFFNSVPMIALR